MSAPNRFVGIFLMFMGVGFVFVPPSSAAPGSKSTAPRSKSPASHAKITKTENPKTVQNVYHTVKSGQTLYSIAREYGVPLKTLASANKISNPANIRTGARLVIPSGGKTHAAPAREIPLSTHPRSSSVGVPPVKPRTETEHAFLTAPLGWPVDGQVVSTFARPRRGHRHKGIDIKTQEGAPVRAVADGTVIRVEEQYGHYGRLIVIEHENGMQSYYGHNSQNLVQVGQDVAAEQTIGLVGHSGNATCDHLHFELHVRGEAVDPLLALASQPGGPTPVAGDALATASTNRPANPAAAAVPGARR